jgi:hypothetical protein
MTTAVRTPVGFMTARLRYLPVAIAASLLHASILIPGYHNDDGSFDAGEWITMLAISLVVSIAVFAFVVPGGGSTSALVLGVLSLLGAVAFWAFFALPLAAAAAVVGLRSRAESSARTKASVAVALAAIAAVATIAITIGDALAN